MGMAHQGITKACAQCGTSFAAASGSAKFCSDRCHILSTAVRRGECLICERGLDEDGYGTLKLSGRRHRKAHRASYEEFKGPIPPGMMVCHSCDTPACIEPEHLFLGTALCNKTDSVTKGRHIHGTGMWTQKLTEDDVLAIMADARSGAAIARHYGVTKENIYAIRKGKIWKHLNRPQQ